MVFTEGTVLMHPSGENASRKERVKQVESESPDIKDYASYIPVGNSQTKLSEWVSQGAEVCYLTSRRKKKEKGRSRRYSTSIR